MNRATFENLSNILPKIFAVLAIFYIFYYFKNRIYLYEYFQARRIERGSDIDARDCAARGGAYINNVCKIPQDDDKTQCEMSGGLWERGQCSIPSVQCRMMGGKYIDGNCVSVDKDIQARINCEMRGGKYSFSTGSCQKDSSKAEQPSFDTTEYANPEKRMYPAAGEVQMTVFSPPYEQQPIDELDDYEYNLIYTNESDKALSKDLRTKLISQYPMHWTTYPPSSTQFQAGYKESFQNAKQNVPDDAKPYENISGSTMQPPDTSDLEREERRILQTYAPEFPPKAQQYDERDANRLIKKVYDAKGLIPEVRHRHGTNVYEIIGTRRKNEKIVYEDEEASATQRANPYAGEGTVPVVSNINELATSSRDSFYSSEKGSANPWQYTAWTPGLERVFAPTDPKQNWY